MRLGRHIFCASSGWLLVFSGCGDARTEIIAESELWPDEVRSEQPNEAIDYRERTAGVAYGIPALGEPGIGDLISSLPQEVPNAFEAVIFGATSLTSQLDSCAFEPVDSDVLPRTIRGVVTSSPVSYQKVTLCGGDERFYGVYTIEDDTGGIVVLRDSRVAPYVFGDSVEMTVTAVAITFSRDLDTRAILLIDSETGDAEAIPDEPGFVLYEKLERGVTADDVVSTVQVEGYVLQAPTNTNFQNMIIANIPVSESVSNEPLTGPRLNCVRTCEGQLLLNNNDCRAEADDICPSACDAADQIWENAVVPVCWTATLSLELGKRPVDYDRGTHVRVRGPILNNFGRHIAIVSTGQIEFLPE